MDFYLILSFNQRAIIFVVGESNHKLGNISCVPIKVGLHWL
jgi:hypothetical protein